MDRCFDMENLGEENGKLLSNWQEYVGHFLLMILHCALDSVPDSLVYLQGFFFKLEPPKILEVQDPM